MKAYIKKYTGLETIDFEKHETQKIILPNSENLIHAEIRTGIRNILIYRSLVEDAWICDIYGMGKELFSFNLLNKENL